MGKFSIRLPDEIEAAIKENAANLGVSVSAYIRDALTGERNTRPELNREIVLDEIESLKKDVLALHNAFQNLADRITYVADFQRVITHRFFDAIGETEAGQQAIEEADRDMMEIGAREEKRDDELSRNQRRGGENVLRT